MKFNFGLKAFPVCAVFLVFLLTGSSGIKCFLDTSGIPEPEPGEVVNTTTFRHFDCSLLGGEEKGCLLRVSKDKIVTRNCAPESGKRRDGCEFDVHSNKICHCFKDFCNDANAINKVNKFIFVSSLVVVASVVINLTIK